MIMMMMMMMMTVRDLCSAILVSRHWRKLGEDPVLWRNYLLEVMMMMMMMIMMMIFYLLEINYGTKLLPETLNFKRFSKLENLTIRGYDPYNEDQMRFDPSLVLNSSIRRLELRLTFIDRNVTDFSCLVTCLSSLTLVFCPLTQVQFLETIVIIRIGSDRDIRPQFTRISQEISANFIIERN